MVAVAEHIKVPELRFPEFSGEWVLNRLGNQVDPDYKIRYGIVQPGDFTPEGLLMVRGQDYSKGWTSTEDVFRVHKSIEAKYKKARLKSGDIVMTIVGANTGHVKTVPPEFHGANITQTTARIRIIKGSPNFWNQILRSTQGKKLVTLNVKGAAQPGLNIRDIEKFGFFVPPNEEQQKIAEFLTAVDEKIGKLKRKKELLEAYKKGAMQKLFSQEIRFKDDQGNPYPDWEEKRLGEVTSKTGKRNKSGLDLPIYSINNKIGFNPQADEFDGLDSNERGYDTTAYKIIKKNTFAYNPARINVGSIGFSGELSGIIISSLYVCFQTSSELSDEFVWHFFRGNSFHQEVLRKSEGGVRMYLFYENFSSIRLAYPTLPEQQKIAEFLTGIDDKITAVANQIDKAAEFKKGLLQKMFV